MRTTLMRVNKTFRFLALSVLCSIEVIAADYPVPLASQKEIREASASTDQISIPDLSLSDYPALKKFSRVKSILMWSRDGHNVTDEKLRALADLKFTNLVDISLLNARGVTDVGISALTNCKSLKSLQLEGTSIGDLGCMTIAFGLSLSGVNVANCKNVTFKGVNALGVSSSITNLTFSVENLTTDEVFRLVNSFTNLSRIQIVDQNGKLDVNAVQAAAAQRRIRAFIRRTGALQDMRLDRNPH